MSAVTDDLQETSIRFDKGQELWNDSNVFLYSNNVGKKSEGEMIPGTVAVYKRNNRLYFMWKADLNNDSVFKFKMMAIDDWNIVDEVSQDFNNDNKIKNKTNEAVGNHSKWNDVWIDLADELKCISIDFGSNKLGSFGANYQHPCLIFTIKKSHSITTGMDDSVDTKLPRFYFHNGMNKLNQLLKLFHRYFWLQRMPIDSLNSDTYTVLDHHSAVVNSIEKQRSQFVRMKPFTSLLAGLSRTRNILKDELIEQFSLEKCDKAKNESLSPLIRSLQDFSESPTNNESIIEHMLSSSDGSLYAFSKLKTSKMLLDKTCYINKEEWLSFFDQDGKLTISSSNLLQRIYTTGIDPSIRKEVWYYLLHYYPYLSTQNERITINNEKQASYDRIKTQWSTISLEQELNFTEFSLHKNIIEKDVYRTDKVLEFYKGENSPNSTKLYNILMTYSMYNFDLGYVQGMSDLLAPLLFLFQDEHSTFWCFVEIMNRFGSNFHADQTHIISLITVLRSIIQYLYPDLHCYFKTVGADTINFVFSWLLMNFKRQFVYSDLYILWDKYFTQSLVKDYSVFLTATIIGSEKDFIMDKHFNGDHILSYFNRIDCQIDVYVLIKQTEIFIENLKSIKFLPPQIQDLVIASSDDL